MKTHKQTESIYSEIFAQIVWRYVNEETFEKLNPEHLLKLQTAFYFQVEKEVLASILKHGNGDLILSYQMAASEKKWFERSFDYERFDMLMSFAVNDQVLMNKVGSDVDAFAANFVAKVSKDLEEY